MTHASNTTLPALPKSSNDYGCVESVKSHLALGNSEKEIYQVLSHDGRYSDFSFLGEGSFSFVVGAKAKGSEEKVAIALQKHPKFDLIFRRTNKRLETLSKISGLRVLEKIDFHSHEWKARNNHKRKLYCLITKYSGENLYTKFCEEGSCEISIALFRKVATQILGFLRKMNKEDYIHRDIKPENILLSDDETQVTVIDYSDVTKTKYSKLHWYEGSRFYRSPNFLRKKNLVADDLFALGATLYEVFTQSILFESKQQKDPSEEVNMRAHLQKVFQILGQPSQAFIKKIPKKIREEFFVEVKASNRKTKTGKSRTTGITYQLIKTRKKTKSKVSSVDLISKKIFQACQKKLPTVTPSKLKATAKQVSDLILTLLKYETPSTPEDVLKLPFFKKPVKV